MIDTSLIHVLKADPATLASWRQAKRATVKGAVDAPLMMWPRS